ncbi:M23 family metallopeptidase [Lysobacter niabensis]|uniref:M23 family metallopeptidase n=1 Tax=Agrilutibacter niabensis TaxID=380628 RepID=UPI0036060BA9
MRALLVFIVGLLAGANVVYLVMSRDDGCARCEAATATAAPDSNASAAATPSAASTTSPHAAPVVAAPATSASAAAPPPAATGGIAAPPLAMPLAGLKAVQLHDSFNEARGGETRHEALDILAPAGTPVYAVADGHVEKLFTSVRGGLTLYQFEPSGRYAYYYAHLQGYAPHLSEGQALKKGQLIGYVGSTGNADPAAPHLHFAVFELGPERQWWKGTAINPYPLLGGVAPAR